jgi:hypothetical protein
MTFETERFGVATTSRARRAHTRARERAVDRLAGRTVWCAGALPRGLTSPLDVEGGEQLRVAARRLESMLDEGPAGVRAEDVVVLHDPLSAALVQAVRERGAHALWHLRMGAGPRGAQSQEAWTFVSAYLLSWSTRGRSGGAERRIAAFVPSSGGGFAKELAGSAPDGLGWASLLADVLEHDRLECVGGTIHVRPVVAAR